MQSFTKFAASRYFSGRRDNSKILKKLLSLHGNGFGDLSGKKILVSLSLELGISVRTLQSRMSELYLMFERFLVNERIANKPFVFENLLLSELAEREEFRISDLVLRRTEKRLVNTKFDSELVYQLERIYMLESDTNFYIGKYERFQLSRSRNSGYQAALFLTGLLTNLTEHYQQVFTGFAKGRIVAEEVVEIIDVTRFLNTLKKTDVFLFKFVLMHYYIYVLFKKLPDSREFGKLQKLFEELTGSMSEAENRQIYFALITYCINQVSLGNHKFLRTVFEIIKKKISSGYDSELRRINYPVNNFRDYVIIGIRVNELDWVKDFIRKYSSLLPEKNRTAERNLALARVFQAEGSNKDALELLKRIKIGHYLNYIDRFSIRSRALYEAGKHLELQEELERAKQYLEKHAEIPSAIRNSYGSSIGILKQILKYKEGRISRDELRLMFRKQNITHAESWISQKLREEIE
ncbi:MAG: hypothetical protein K1X85_01030 [Ignavibacteria bacterium]|nr:hypothetical protein [Ignavibacteria bacterium]